MFFNIPSSIAKDKCIAEIIITDLGQTAVRSCATQSLYTSLPPHTHFVLTFLRCQLMFEPAILEYLSVSVFALSSVVKHP